MINELFEISCKTPHFCIGPQLRPLKSELIWNIPSSVSSQYHTPWPASQTKYYVGQATHTSKFFKSRPKCTAARHIFSTISSQCLILSWNSVSYLIYNIKNLITYTDANYKALSNRSNFLSTTYKTSQKRLQAKRFYHKCPNVVQWRARKTNMGTRCFWGKLFQSKLMANMKALTYKPVENMPKRLYY